MFDGVLWAHDDLQAEAVANVKIMHDVSSGEMKVIK